MVPAQPMVTLSFFRFGRWRDRAWAFAQMGLARLALPRVPGIGAWKLMGAGTGQGFTPVPDPGVACILATWPDLGAAEAGLAAPVFERYAARAAERYRLTLETTSARGRWGGVEPFAVGTAAGPGPVAALTRGTIRLRALRHFWAAEPAISARIGRDPNVLFKAGVGEMPWLHQVTLSVWPDARSMANFARAAGPHAAAIRGVREGAWFAEELYARFAVRAHAGTWRGRDPLAGRPASTVAAE
jgi:spheroidene monooxygenase